MGFHLERSIRFAPEEKDKHLYKWSLQEVADDGRPVGGKQIPWWHRFKFVATKIRIVNRFEASVDVEGNPHEPTSSELIELTLQPDDSEGRAVRFSMFGTSRVIKSFNVSVRRAEDGVPQCCILWGCPSHSYGFYDYGSGTVDDVLNFTIKLEPNNFETLKHAARHASGEYFVHLWVSQVYGFYSEPQILPIVRTLNVKVLTAHKEHAVTVPDGVAVEGEEVSESVRELRGPWPVLADGELPRLGTVGEFTLHVIRRSELPVKSINEPSDRRSDLPVKSINEPSDGADEPEPQAAEATPAGGGRSEDAISNALAEIARSQKSMAKLRLPLWLLVLLALAILLLHK